MHRTPRRTLEAPGEKQHTYQASGPMQNLFVRQGPATARQRDRRSVPFAAGSRITGGSLLHGAASLAQLNRRPGQPKPDLLRNLPPNVLFALQAPVLPGLPLRLS